MNKFLLTVHVIVASGCVLAAAALFSPDARAVQADISSTPLSAINAAQVKPNVMLLMDTSTSMGWTHMPDEVESDNNKHFVNGQLLIGYKSSQCNSLYYNPATTYALPRKPDGSFFPPPSFTNAFYAGYGAYYVPAGDAVDLSYVNLATSFQAYDKKTLKDGSNDPDLAQPAYYYVYTGSQTLNYANAPCTDIDDGVNGSRKATGGGTWTRVLVGSTSAAQQSNFAIWYSYYRTRIALTKSAASLAFTPLTDSFRIGFITVEPAPYGQQEINQDKYLQIHDFDTTQRVNWFNKLFSQVADGASPAREGLARVGRHYGNKHDLINTGMDGDPVQYYCQQNITIMTTDGYWNAQTESPGGGPLDLNGAFVGQQDGTLTGPLGNTPRPIYDGATDATQVIEDNEVSYRRDVCGSFAMKTTWQNVATTKTNLQSTSQLTKTVSQTQQKTSQLLATTKQNLQTTLQYNVRTNVDWMSTYQWQQSTFQRLATTSQWQLTTYTPWKRVTIAQQSTSQMKQSTWQTQASSTQTLKSTHQLKQFTEEPQQRKIQKLQTMTLPFMKETRQTKQHYESTSRVDTYSVATTTQMYMSTSRSVLISEGNKPVPSPCVSKGASTCSKPITTGPTVEYAGKCVPNDGKSSNNNYTTVTCTPSPPVATRVPNCPFAHQAESDFNHHTTTDCQDFPSAPVMDASCQNADPTPPNFITSRCTTTPTAEVAVQNCVNVTAVAGNGTATVCVPHNTPPAQVASCSNDAPTAANEWTETLCSGGTTQQVAVASCTDPTPGACTTLDSGWKSVQGGTCFQELIPTQSNSFTVTQCQVVNQTPETPVANCAQPGWVGGVFVDVHCNSYDMSPTGVAEGTCVEDPVKSTSNNFTTTHCEPNNVGWHPVASCVKGTDPLSFVSTDCKPNDTVLVPVSGCAESDPDQGNAYTKTRCFPYDSAVFDVDACTFTDPSFGNGYTTTTCYSPKVVIDGPSATCTPGLDSSTHQLTNCDPKPSTQAVQSCTPSADCQLVITPPFGVQTCTNTPASALNQWTTTTCLPDKVTSNVPVPSCDESPGSEANHWVDTTCYLNKNEEVAVAPGSCQAVQSQQANQWTSIVCGNTPTGPTPVAGCTNITAQAPAWLTTTCTPEGNTDVPVQSCIDSPASSNNSWVKTTCHPNDLTNVPVATCMPGPASADNNWTTTVSCNQKVLTDWTPVLTCTAGQDGNFVKTECITVTNPKNGDPPVGVAQCTDEDPNPQNLYIRTTCATVPGPTIPVATCTPSGPDANYVYITCPAPLTSSNPVLECVDAPVPLLSDGWTTTACSTPIKTGPVQSPDCTEGVDANFVHTHCDGVSAQKISYHITHTVTTNLLSGGIIARTVSSTSSTGAQTDLSACDPVNVPVLPGDGPAGRGAPGPDAPVSCAQNWPCSTVTPNPGSGSSNSLADVAQYYYVTDLRPDFKDGVPSTGIGPEDDGANIHGQQHMTTFAVGLGVSGTLNYRGDYKTATTGDFAGIRSGALSWPIWPDSTVDSTFDSYSKPQSIDDFWHTAVNGRGQYFSANNPSSVVAGLSGALASVNTRVSTGAAVGASNLQPVVGDNFVYLGSYKTVEWSGDVTASTFNLVTGTIDPTTNWSASAQLGQITKDFCDNRQIYLMRGSALANFSWNSQTCDAGGNPTGTVDTGLNTAEMANFDASKIALLSQKPSMTDGTGTTVDQITPAAGANLVNFLRGQRGLEGFESNVATKLYRTRASSLGDIVGGQPIYVSKPNATYADSGYAAFASAHVSRIPMVYVAANDGMLHAFYADATTTDPQAGGKEAWAIVPSAMLPNLYKLADNNYKNTHQFFVDGTPTVADVKNGSNWRTMLVGGFNDGGKGYYAVDVTDPVHPTAMWEFKLSSACGGVGSSSDCNLGLSYGKPIVTKVADGTPGGRWVVLVSSGYNNVNGAAYDGHGFLYVLDANTGVILQKIDTGAGDATTPSNLGQLNAYVDDAAVNNLALRAYGGDMLGNVVRFNIASSTPNAVLVGQAKDNASVPQPITTRPELAELNGKTMVFVGTGRLLGTTDSTNLQTQSIYGIVDPLSPSSPEYADLRTALKTMTMASGGNTRTIACTANCSSTKGWFVDLPDSGERVNVDMQLALSTLVVGSNVPTTDVCDSGGYSWLSYFDIASGEANGSFGDTPGTTSKVSERADNSLIVGLSVIRLPDRTFRTELSLSTPVGTSGGGLLDTKNGHFPTPPPTGKRISWRAVNPD